MTHPQPLAELRTTLELLQRLVVGFLFSLDLRIFIACHDNQDVTTNFKVKLHTSYKSEFATKSGFQNDRVFSSFVEERHGSEL